MEGKEKGVPSEEELEYMMNYHPTTDTFYALPKVHKNQLTPSGRPIVTGNHNLTEKASRYIDFVMRPYVYDLSSYIEDTWDFLNKLEGVTLTDDNLLARLAVEALYSNISHDLGLEACEHFFNTRGIIFQQHTHLI